MILTRSSRKIKIHAIILNPIDSSVIRERRIIYQIAFREIANTRRPTEYNLLYKKNNLFINDSLLLLA